MIPQAPINQTPQTTTIVSEVQAADQLERQDVEQTIKEIMLKQLILSSVSQNETASVTTGVSVIDLQSHHEIVGHNQNLKHFAASVNKVPIALLLLEDLRAGTLDMDQTVTWQLSDVRGGFGLYDQPGAPMQAPLRDVIYDMLNRSGNTVVKASVNYLLGGAEQVNQRWAAKPQLANTNLTLLGGGAFYLGDSTPADSLWALEQINAGQDRDARFMKEAMSTNIFEDFGVRSQLHNTNFVILVNKIGLLDDIEGNNRHDVGIIYNRRTGKSYGYSFFTTSPFDSPTATPRADESLQEMGRYVLRFAGDKKRAEQRDPDSVRSPRGQARVEARVRY